METNVEDWISRWARPDERIERRLREAVANERGRKLLSWLRQHKIPPDGLGFCLVHLVWPVQRIAQELTRHPYLGPTVRAKRAQQLRKIAQWLRKRRVRFNSSGSEPGCEWLEQCADKLQKGHFFIETDSFCMDLDGVASFTSRRDVAKIQVIAFLRAYFVIAGDTKRLRYAKRRTWEQITEILILAGLYPPGTKPKLVATFWSTKWKRANDKTGEIEYQTAMFMWFHGVKRKVDGKPLGTDVSMEIHKILKDYWCSERMDRTG
jgi:hypothetical protein